jgi:hypothetical protein
MVALRAVGGGIKKETWRVATGNKTYSVFCVQ